MAAGHTLRSGGATWLWSYHVIFYPSILQLDQLKFQAMRSLPAL